ncbi:heat-inducible transcriptional repressor HrcA [Enemella sp. A6]|uniref:heat-inducible transcriptional repressor HrcA n=1 Tax=Enemella sp. A6 TaxID=3440152 RepID=UPI003EBF4042
MDDRKMQVLRAIVTDYVSSQEPVGSKALVERHRLGVSPATVRNDMAVLEEEGYITQPHTSAGRIPTDKGYRLFVDRIAQVKPLSVAERRAIGTFLSGAADLDDVVARTVRLLAQVTHQVAIVQYPIVSSESLRHVELVELHPERLMVIAVSSSGRVDQRSIEVPRATEDDVAEVKNRINAAAVDRPVQEVAGLLAPLVDELPAHLTALGSAVITALLQLVSAEQETRVVVGGVTNLARFGADFESTIAPVLEALEEQVVLLRLLGEAATGGELTVRIGQENPYEQLQATSLIATSYGSPDDVWASLGIVGPTRMDYPSTMASVRAVARYVSRFLAQG